MGLPFAPSSALRKRLHMQGALLNYAALLRALKLRLILRQHQNSAHFGGFIFSVCGVIVFSIKLL